MIFYFLISTILFFSIYSIDDYQLSIDIFFSGEIKFDLKLFNQGLSDNQKNIYYSGIIENIEDILYYKKGRDEEKEMSIKSGDHPLVNILENDYIEYMNLFPLSTIFIIREQLNKYIYNYNKDQIIFLIDDSEYFIYSDYLSSKSFYYVKLGKKIDNQNLLSILIFLNAFIPLLISFIMKKLIKTSDQANQLPIHYLICNIADLLFISNLANGLAFLLFREKEFYFIIEYMTLFMYSFYKSIFYPTIILILLGWSIITFSVMGNLFKLFNKRILYYDLIFSIIIILSVYFISITSKLNLFYIKNISEHIALLSFAIYSVFKKLIPLAKQKNYEQRIRSNLVKCINFKYKKVLFTTIIIITYTIFFINTPILEHKYIYYYIDNFNIHLIFQLFFECVFLLLLFILFYPRKLPRYYFDEVLFNYKIKVFLLADISVNQQGKNKSNNISNLTFEKLKKISKKENYPIVLLNPFASPKNRNLFEEVHIGNAQKYQK